MVKNILVATRNQFAEHPTAIYLRMIRKNTVSSTQKLIHFTHNRFSSIHNRLDKALIIRALHGVT